MRRRTLGLSLTAAALLVVLGATAPPGTLSFLLRRPIVLLREIISLIRNAAAPPQIAEAAGANPFFSLRQPTSAIFGSTSAMTSFDDPAGSVDLSSSPARNIQSPTPAPPEGSTPKPDQGSGPVQEVVGPVEEIAEPVEEVVEPIEEVVDPIQEAVEPVVEPVEQTVEPIVEPVEQIVDPIVDPVEPPGGTEPPGGVEPPGLPEVELPGGP